MSTAKNISRILKNEACKLDGVAAVLTDKGVSSYLRTVAAAIIDEANSVEDLLCDRPFEPKQSPQDTDSAETVVEPEPIEPMADLSAVDYAPAFEGYQPNGALPETD
jgi:hypothetical protein